MSQGFLSISVIGRQEHLNAVNQYGGQCTCKTRPGCFSLGSDYVISCPPEYDTVALRSLGECKVRGIRMSCNNEF